METIRDRARLAVIIPIYDEEPCLEELFRRLGPVLDRVRQEEGIECEVVAVDDGSRDGSRALLSELARADPRVRVVELDRNRGQHEAVLAGFAASAADLFVTIDADLQNPPEEIPRLVAALLEGHDLVATRRVRREDALRRRLVSRLANFTSRALARPYTAVPLHDIGCMLRGYRRELVDAVLEEARRPGAPPPFIPALTLRFAHRVCELAVHHAPRAHGSSRYSFLGLLRLQARLVSTLWPGPGGRPGR